MLSTAQHSSASLCQHGRQLINRGQVSLASGRAPSWQMLGAHLLKLLGREHHHALLGTAAELHQQVLDLLQLRVHGLAVHVCRLAGRCGTWRPAASSAKDLVGWFWSVLSSSMLPSRCLHVPQTVMTPHCTLRRVARVTVHNYHGSHLLSVTPPATAAEQRPVLLAWGASQLARARHGTPAAAPTHGLRTLGAKRRGRP